MIPFASRQIVAMILCHAEIPLTPNPIMLMRGMLSFGDGLMSFWGVIRKSQTLHFSLTHTSALLFTFGSWKLKLVISLSKKINQEYLKIHFLFPLV